MIIGNYLAVFALILTGMVGIIIVARMRQIQAVKNLRAVSQVDLSRYRPMQRLLSGEDLALVAGDKVLLRQLRKHRCSVVRGYLRCMTKDYSALYAAVRRMMVEATEDRPDLVKVILFSRVNFAWSLCAIEARLALYRFGIGTIDLTGVTNQVTSVQRLIQDSAA
jgi:hypothetical protein